MLQGTKLGQRKASVIQFTRLTKEMQFVFASAGAKETIWGNLGTLPRGLAVSGV